jgi:hypothetical protein
VNSIAPKSSFGYGNFLAGHTFATDSALLDDRLDLKPGSSLDHLQAASIAYRIATQRMSIDGQGRVVYRYKQPSRDGSTPVVLEPLDFIGWTWRLFFRSCAAYPATIASRTPRSELNMTAM